MAVTPTSPAAAPRLRLSVLDQSPIPAGTTARQALANTLALARHADAWGYTRYWVAEHHNSTALAGSTPEVLLARLGAETARIRIGSGGVMLPHYSALKVAENFRLLEALYPHRVDLGIGRAPGTDRLTAHLLNPANTFDENTFVDQLQDLDRYLTDAPVPGPAAAQVVAVPRIDTVPERWLLSSSGQSGLLAAYLGWQFAFAHFINPHGGPEAVRAYHARFRPSPLLAAPQATVAIFVVCADTPAKAQALADAQVLQLLRFERGERSSFPAPADVSFDHLTPAERERVAYHRQRILSGTPAEVGPQLLALAAAYGVEEVMVVTITHDFADRLRSYELLAEAVGLAESAAPA